MRRSAGLQPLVMHAHPVSRRDTHLRTWPVAALVLVVDPASRPRIDPALAAAVLGLTRMESRVAVLLAEGKSLRDIAEATGRKVGTIRWHRTQIFRKHGLSRQAELVQLVRSLAVGADSRH